MARPAPNGPLTGDELGLATKRLTDRQLRAYQYRREGQPLNWIARRMGVSRTRVVHLVAAAEKRLGYALTVTPKQKAPYKSAARRRDEGKRAAAAYADELVDQLEPSELKRLADILETAASVEERDQLLRARLEELERERHARAYPEDDDWSTAVGQAKAEFFASLAEDGFTRNDGSVLAPEDFVEDDGKGYDRL